ncbi:MAG: sialidase, partial [Frankiaceae bacterium]|nr:sialidase [Arenimonas sp.]
PPPLVPPAAQLAGSSTRGPRVVPGTYTVRMSKGAQTYETKVAVGLDPRSPFTVADRQAQFDAAMKVHGMFGEMSDLVARIQAVREGARSAAATLPESDPLRAQLSALAGKADDVRKKIVATKEGGAITGEERLREHMDNLYGGILGYDGRPTDTLIQYTGALKQELGDIAAQFEELRSKDLASANLALKAKGLPEIALPEHAPVAWRFSGNPDTRPAERD